MRESRIDQHEEDDVGWRADELRTAIADAQLELHYQPVVDLATGAPVGVEALVRWRNPEHGLVCPDDFLPAVVEHRLESDLCRFVLTTACEQLVEWQTDALVATDFGLAVNMTTENFTRPDVADSLLTLVAGAGLDPSSLTIEITEQTIMRAPEAARSAAERLRAAGVRISLDDFGTGYSTISALSQMPVDELKIDRWFVARLDDEVTAQLVEGLAGLARHLDLSLVAEGVETLDQARWLAGVGFTRAQGFLWSRALGAPDFEELVSGRRSAWDLDAMASGDQGEDPGDG